MNIKNKRILIIGGSGSWGNFLTERLLEESPEKIIIYSRGEISQIAMMRRFNDPRVKFVIGDVRDRKALFDIISGGTHYIFHLAALKHVPTCEHYPYEAIQTNINGMVNVIDAAIKYAVEKVIYVSTDKAVNPLNMYGLTKAVGEKLMIQANSLTSETDFICVRSGNVLGTNGSVVPYMINQIKTKNQIQLTDLRMTRFFISFRQVISLLFHAVEIGKGGETFVINMPSFYVRDLAEILLESHGGKGSKITITGIREGEKLNELLISEHELKRTYFIDEFYYAICPEIKTGRVYSFKNEALNISEHGLSSRDNLKDRETLRQLLIEGGYLKND